MSFALIEGNHELRVHKQIKGYLGELVCSRFNWKFFLDCAFLKFAVVKGETGNQLYIQFMQPTVGRRENCRSESEQTGTTGIYAWQIFTSWLIIIRCVFLKTFITFRFSKQSCFSEMKRTFVSSGCF